MTRRPAPAALRLAAGIALLSFAWAAGAQSIPYKVIGPDGKITYTDRPALTPDSRVSPLGRTAVTDTAVALPLELRQAVERYPVTLYTTTDDCAPCAAANRLLRDRGVPFSERQVQSADDIAALERLSGGREAPTLGVGGQILRGLTPELWQSYLDAAGYPRESRLPPNYRYPSATPLVARATPPAAPVNPTPDTFTAQPEPPVNGGSGIKF